jgi:hypothetical protein
VFRFGKDATAALSILRASWRCEVQDAEILRTWGAAVLRLYMFVGGWGAILKGRCDSGVKGGVVRRVPKLGG